MHSTRPVDCRGMSNFTLSSMLRALVTYVTRWMECKATANVTGSDQHGMYSCPKCKATTALCKVCGSEAHWTRACHQRYFPEEFASSVRAASGVNRGRVSRLPWTRKKPEKAPEKGSKTEESAGAAATEKGVAASAALLENPLGWALGL